MDDYEATSFSFVHAKKARPGFSTTYEYENLVAIAKRLTDTVAEACDDLSTKVVVLGSHERQSSIDEAFWRGLCRDDRIDGYKPDFWYGAPSIAVNIIPSPAPQGSYVSLSRNQQRPSLLHFRGVNASVEVRDAVFEEFYKPGCGHELYDSLREAYEGLRSDHS